ncbi:MAG: hypothetical protein WCB67_19560 [Solirubrobacteraceae bacterium]
MAEGRSNRFIATQPTTDECLPYCNIWAADPPAVVAVHAGTLPGRP